MQPTHQQKYQDQDLCAIRKLLVGTIHRRRNYINI